MRNLFHIIGKDLKLLLRSRSSALIIIAAPLLVILLLGLAFDNANTFGLTIGVYSPSQTPNVDSVTAKLNEKGFTLKSYTDEASCVEDVKTGASNTCLIFPENFELGTNEQKKVTFYVDYSKVNLVWMVMEALNAQLDSKAQEVSRNLAANLLEKLSATKTELETKKPIISQLKTDAGEITAKAQSVSSSIAAIDLTYNADAVPIETAKNLTSNITAAMTANLNLAKANVSSAKSFVNETSAIAKLDQAITSIENAKESIGSADDASLDGLSSLLSTMQTELEGLKARLAAANSSKVTATASLSEITQKLDQSVQNINQIESAFSAIVDNINSVSVTNADAVAQPLITEIKPVNTESTYLNYLFPSLMVLVIMFVSLLLGTTLVMMEKHSPAHFQNFITPTRTVTFILATYITTMIMVAIQTAIMLAIAGYFFSAQILPSLHLVVLILLIAATFFTFLGMFVGYIFTSEETSTLGSISLGSIFLFLSNVIIPSESMPQLMREITAYNPFVIGERVLRSVVLFTPTLESVLWDVGLLAAYGLGFFIIIWSSQKLISKHYLQKVAYYHHKKKREELQHRELEQLKKKTSAAAQPVQKQAAAKKEEMPSMFSVMPSKKKEEPVQQGKPDQKQMLEEEMRRIQDELRKIGSR